MKGQREEGMRLVLSCAASLGWSPEEETGAPPAPCSGGSHTLPVSTQPSCEVTQPDWGGEVWPSGLRYRRRAGWTHPVNDTQLPQGMAGTMSEVLWAL